jgi:hypothetical protein
VRRWSDVEAMISEPAIDKRTEEKMYFGTLAPEDAPPGFARVAVLLRAAAAPRTDAGSGSMITDTEKLRQQHVVAAMAAVIAAGPEGLPAGAHGHSFRKVMSPARPKRVGRRRHLGRARLVLVMAFGMMIACASMAFAGVLPSPVQHAASVLFAKVGVHVPDGGVSQGIDSREPGSSSGHEKVTGSDKGNGADVGKHIGQGKNGDRGFHRGRGGENHRDGGNGGANGNAGSQGPVGTGSGAGNGSAGSNVPQGNEGAGGSHAGGRTGHHSFTLPAP